MFEENTLQSTSTWAAETIFKLSTAAFILRMEPTCANGTQIKRTERGHPTPTFGNPFCFLPVAPHQGNPLLTCDSIDWLYLLLYIMMHKKGIMEMHFERMIVS